jgi:hypothetical protein
VDSTDQTTRPLRSGGMLVSGRSSPTLRVGSLAIESGARSEVILSAVVRTRSRPFRAVGPGAGGLARCSLVGRTCFPDAFGRSLPEREGSRRD